jgi:hypothetical protein
MDGGDLITSDASSAPRTALRRIAPVVVLVAFVVVGGLAGWLFVSSRSPSLPPSRLAEWRVSVSSDGTTFSRATAQTTTEIPISFYPRYCTGVHAFPRATPEITYTPEAVIVTLHVTETIVGSTDGDNTAYLPTCALRYDTAVPAVIQLSEPLSGRTLLDGSTSPPAARPYTTP